MLKELIKYYIKNKICFQHMNSSGAQIFNPQQLFLANNFPQKSVTLYVTAEEFWALI